VWIYSRDLVTLFYNSVLPSAFMEVHRRKKFTVKVLSCCKPSKNLIHENLRSRWHMWSKSTLLHLIHLLAGRTGISLRSINCGWGLYFHSFHSHYFQPKRPSLCGSKKRILSHITKIKCTADFTQFSYMYYIFLLKIVITVHMIIYLYWERGSYTSTITRPVSKNISVGCYVY